MRNRCGHGLWLCLLTATAPAAPVRYFGNLNGPAESPPNASPGTGYALVTMDVVAHTMVIDANFSGLLGTTTASHIHCCTSVPGAGTASVATVTPSFPGFPLGVTSGAYTHSFSLSDTGSYNATFVMANGGTAAGAEAALDAGIAGGRAYFNIHSQVFAGGEIRAFLTADSIFIDGFE